MVKITPDGTISISLTLPWADIQTAYQNHLKRHAQTVETKGFRKGKAPLDTVAKTVGKAHIYQDAFSQLFLAFYSQIVKDEKLQPLIAPEVKAIKTKEGEDWLIEAVTAQAPQISLGDYQVEVRGALTSASDDQKLGLVFDALLKTAKISVSPILVNQEKNQALSRLLDQVNRLGLTIDQYLASKQLTSQQLQEEYAATATTNLKLEFVLQAIAQDFKIKPKSTDIDQLATKSPKTPKAYIAAILTKRLTIDALLKL